MGCDALAETRRVHRHVAPPENELALADHQLSEQVLADDSIDWVLREEDHADAVVAGRRELDLLLGHLWSEEPVGDLEQHSRTVAGEGIGTDGATVGEVGENGEALSMI